MLLGAHVSVAGRLANAPAHGRAIGADVIQVFTRNQLQWKTRPVSVVEASDFKRAMADSGLQFAVAHASYLINLASPDWTTLARSRRALLGEVRRCHALGIPCLVLHPGSHMGAGEAAGIHRVVASLDHVFERAEGLAVEVLLEATAGQGSSLGHRFEHLAEIVSRSRFPGRLGVCLDTCHLLAAGYDIASPLGFGRTVREVDAVVGLSRVKAIHLNDARAGLGSRLDRHAPIGRGHLGLAAFRRLLRDARFQGVPMLLETPGPLAEWKREIALLRRLAAGAERRPRRHPTYRSATWRSR